VPLPDEEARYAILMKKLRALDMEVKADLASGGPLSHCSHSLSPPEHSNDTSTNSQPGPKAPPTSAGIGAAFIPASSCNGATAGSPKGAAWSWLRHARQAQHNHFQYAGNGCAGPSGQDGQHTSSGCALDASAGDALLNTPGIPEKWLQEAFRTDLSHEEISAVQAAVGAHSVCSLRFTDSSHDDTTYSSTT
jgi:hypothetical protein